MADVRSAPRVPISDIERSEGLRGRPEGSINDERGMKE